MKKNSDSAGFSSRIGYILAAAGSAIGLGNIWRFPYCAARNGGGIFLLTYLVLVLTFGYVLLISENALGRMTGKGPIGSYNELCSSAKGPSKWLRIGGWINAVVPIIIVPYYCVIGGWVTKYCAALAFNPISRFASPDACGSYFGCFIRSSGESLLYFVIFMALVVIVVALGVEKGIERASKILMPLLFLMILICCGYSFFLPGAKAGLSYYLVPNFSKFSFATVSDAMSQMFFSLSIAMGIMVTYGSYMRKEDNISSNVNHVAFLDTAVAFLAGLMIIPAVVAFGGEKAAEASGPGLVFVTMPQVFAHFPGGRFFGTLFFVLVLFAAVTSAISLLETNVQTLSQELRISRKKALCIGIGDIIILGILCILGYNLLKNVHPLGFIGKYASMDILDSFDFLSNCLLMPIAACFNVGLVLFVIGKKRFTEEILHGNTHWKQEKIFWFCMRFFAIPCLVIVLLSSLKVI